MTREQLLLTGGINDITMFQVKFFCLFVAVYHSGEIMIINKLNTIIISLTLTLKLTLNDHRIVCLVNLADDLTYRYFCEVH